MYIVGVRLLAWGALVLRLTLGSSNVAKAGAKPKTKSAQAGGFRVVAGGQARLQGPRCVYVFSEATKTYVRISRRMVLSTHFAVLFSGQPHPVLPIVSRYSRYPREPSRNPHRPPGTGMCLGSTGMAGQQDTSAIGGPARFLLRHGLGLREASEGCWGYHTSHTHIFTCFYIHTHI